MTKNLARREVQKFHFSARSLGELLNRKLLDRKLLDYLKANFCQISKYRKLLRGEAPVFKFTFKFKSTFDRLPLGCLSARARARCCLCSNLNLNAGAGASRGVCLYPRPHHASRS